jgi:Phosphodiester glycosidase
MLKKRTVIAIIVSLVCLVSCAFLASGGYWLWSNFRPQPDQEEHLIYQGVQYQRLVRQTPRLMVIHIVTVNLRQKGLSLLVTPGDPKAEKPLKARTTGSFLEEFDLQLAVNGDGFTPWYSNSLLDYYPKAGDSVTPLGLAASNGVVYAQNPQNHPVLYFSRNNQARFNSPPGRIYNAISGNPILVLQGREAMGGRDNRSDQSDDSPADQPQPRSAIGLDKSNRRLIIVVVDGRQPGYSEGATLSELAQIMIDAGAYSAMNLDGGGSSTLVRQANNGSAEVINSPIDNHIPGRQRSVANHLGIYAPALASP